MSINSRLNYFKGFFTTAGDWTAEQNYHIEKRKLHNRRLHSPGVVQGEGLEMALEARGGLQITLLPGVAIDGEGNEICVTDPMTFVVDPAAFALPATVFIGIRYTEAPSHLVENTEIPQYSGYTRVSESYTLVRSAVKPDNKAVIELGRIQLQAGATVVTNPLDPTAPGADEIDRRYVVKAGALGLVPEKLPFTERERIAVLMMRLRKDFAALDFRFPVPSSGDVRHGVMTVEMLARTDGLPEDSVASVLSTLAVVCHDVGQEIAVKYPPVAGKYPPVSLVAEFDAYMQAVAALIKAIQDGENLDTILTRMDEVGVAARELAELILLLPVANAGQDMTTTVPQDGTVLAALDASHSQAFGGRSIVRYHWRFPDFYSVPQASSGLDQTVFAAGENETVVLDASASKAYGGKGIVRYNWTLKNE
jgi:hypothetical protein